MDLLRDVDEVKAKGEEYGQTLAEYQQGCRNFASRFLAFVGIQPSVRSIRRDYRELYDSIEELVAAAEATSRDLDDDVQSAVTSPVDDESADDWEDRQLEVFRRDEWRCRNCGHRGGRMGDADLHAHHVVPVGCGGESSLPNLVTLCSNCHRAAHGGTAAD